jgi:hypothetical protein
LYPAGIRRPPPPHRPPLPLLRTISIRLPIAITSTTPRLAPRPLHTNRRPPGSLGAIQGSHSVLGFFDGGEVDEEVVVVTWVEAFRGVWGEDFGNVCAVLPTRIVSRWVCG